MLTAFFAYGLLAVAGYLACPSDKKGSMEGMRPFAAPALGFGLASAALFFNLLHSDRLYAAATAGSLAALCLVLFWKRKAVPAARRFSLSVPEFLLIAFSLFLFSVAFFKSPYGSGLDVWAIWKLKARFIYLDHWRAIFDPAHPYSHPVYPLLYPLMLCWGWSAAGGETVATSFVLFAVVNASAVGLLIASARKLGLRHAWAAGLFFIAAPHWSGLSSSQYADAMVAYYNLAGMAFLFFALKDDLPPAALAGGLLLGMGTFVKSEGYLALTAASLGALAAARWKEPAQRRALRSFFFGAGLFLAVSLLFRLTAALPDQMVSRAHMAEWLARPDKLERLAVIARSWWSEILVDNHWSYQWGLLLLVYLFQIKDLRRPENLLLTVFLWVELAGYAAVYSMTQMDLQFHLDTSLDRCMLHVFPVAVLLGVSLVSRSAWYNSAFPKRTR